jgi:DNA-directed RNA polymerase specialized sigma24 family protein
MDVSDWRAYTTYEQAIEWAIKSVVRRWRWRVDEAEDFAQDVRLYFLEHREHLRSVDGPPHPRLYFLRIVVRRAVDWERHRRGRWRPSSAAKREGPVAAALDGLVSRDGLSVAEAIETLHVSLGTPRAVVEATARALRRQRSARVFLSWEHPRCAAVADPAIAADPLALVMQRDAIGPAERVADRLARALALLDDRERAIVSDYVGRLSRAGGRERTPARLRQVLTELQQMLAIAGIDSALAVQAIESGLLGSHSLIEPHPAAAARRSRKSEAS